MNRKITDIVPLIIFTILVAIFIRLFPIVLTDFPVNDGGMILSMAQDIKDLGYSLPKFTSYNSANIPFAYPPLAIYFVAIISDLTTFSMLNLLRWLPAIISILTIPAFYGLSRVLVNSKNLAILSTLIFSLLPKSYEWQIMGGGITRGLGLFFALLTLRYWVLTIKTKSNQHQILTTLGLTMTILSHPEAGWFAIYSMVLVLVFKKLKKVNSGNLFQILFGSALLTIPWWATVIKVHGLSTLFSAANTGGDLITPFYYLFTFDFVDQPFLDIFGVLALLALFFQIIRKKLLFPAWLVITLFLNSRSASRFITIPIAILVSIAIETIIFPAIKKAVIESQKKKILKVKYLIPRLIQKNLHINNLYPLVIGVILFYGSLSAIVFPLSQNGIGIRVLSPQERVAMSWIKENTNTDTKFLVMPGSVKDNWAIEKSIEWFPTLSQRTNISTVQGYEWLPNQFISRVNYYSLLRECNTKTTQCLEEWENITNLYFTHVYISKTIRTIPEIIPPCCTILENSLQNSPDFKMIFENTDVVIFARNT